MAFEGLPLDSKLFPAVGLYQRDDRVTLLNVESGGRSSGQDGVIDGVLAGGSYYYPSVPESMTDNKPEISRIAKVKRHNDILSWDGIQYVTEFLRSLSDKLHSSNDQSADLLCSVLPSIAASLSLLPASIPLLSQRFGVAILPHVSRCIQEMHSSIKAQRVLFSYGIRQGKWVIRATGSNGSGSNTECEEYVVDFVKSTRIRDVLFGFHGSGVGTTGKSKNGLVSIVGTVSGSDVHFVEDWTDGNEKETSSSDSATSSCVVTARTNLDGTRFEGSYRNVQYGTSGQISGILTAPAVPDEDESKDLKGIALQCEALLCLAQGHLASILAEDIAGDYTCKADEYQPAQVSAERWKNQCLSLKEWISSPLLANGLVDLDNKILTRSLFELRQVCVSPLPDAIPYEVTDQGVVATDILTGAVSSKGPHHLANLASCVDRIDDIATGRSGGKGSLISLCPREYSAARRKVICALIHHGNLRESVVSLSEDSVSSVDDVSDDLITVWMGSLKIMEDGIRSAISSTQDHGRTRKEVAIDACENIDLITYFLLNVMPDDKTSVSLNARVNEVVSFYATVRCKEDLYYIQAEMECSTKRALLRTSALEAIASVLTNIEGARETNSEDAVAVECISIVLPRLMGRNWAKQGPGRHDSRHGEDLGGYYLAMLSGSVRLPEETLRAAVSTVYRALGRILERYSNDKAMDDSSRNSLLLSMLAGYIVTIRAVDVPAVISDCCLFELLSGILEASREAICATRIDLAANIDKAAALRAIQQIKKRDTSRCLLRAATSIVHVLAFQLPQFTAQAAQPDLLKNSAEIQLRGCLELIFGELAVLIPLIESTMRLEFSESSKLLASEDWESWCGVCLSGGHRSVTQRRCDASTGNIYKAGILFLIEHGVGSASGGNQVTSQKPAIRTGNLASSDKATARSEALGGMLTLCCQQYLSQWLNILACLTKSETALRMISENYMLTDGLLSAVGLSCDRTASGILSSSCVRINESSLLPARYRARILRLMRGILALIKPCESVVEGLLSLGGMSMASNSRDSGDYFISRETVSLLRYLHLPAFPSWRQCVLGVISRHINMQDGKDASTVMSLGIRLFLGGSINTLGRGAYVLLKPPAAARLSPDAQASPSSKLHSSSGNSGAPSGIGISPHHIAGNGTEGIVAGLCRADAPAGIVSSVLVKNGACEVILMNRHRLPSSEDDILLTPDGESSSAMNEKSSINSRRSLTVRALRTPLLDVALAEEVPLIVDSSLDVHGLLGLALPLSLHQFKDGTSIAPSEESEENSATDGNIESKDLGAALATLRSAMAVTSNKELLEIFLKRHSSSGAFAHVLSLACDGDALRQIESRVKDGLQSESLSELPKHEAQYAHLNAMLREINARQQVLHKVPLAFWEKKRAEQRDAREVAGTDSTVDSGGVSVPPAGVSTELDAHDSSVRDVVSSLGEEEPRRTESNRMVSQSTVSTNNSTDDDEEGEAAATAAAHLREAAIAQMAELGLPRSWSELALRRTGGTNLEAAVHFCKFYCCFLPAPYSQTRALMLLFHIGSLFHRFRARWRHGASDRGGARARAHDAAGVVWKLCLASPFEQR